MGQNQAKELTAGPKANYHPEVEVVQEKIFEPHYGEVKIVKDKETEQLLILKETVVNTKQAYETELTFLNNRIELRHPNIAEIVGYNSKDQQNFCSTYYKLQVYIEVLENTLLNELENRISTQIPYNESEILLVADSLIAGLSYFQSQGFSHGDIRPYNVFVQGHNIYKLSDPSLSAHKGQHGLHLSIIQGQKSLLAPELVSQVPASNFEIKSDKNKADVFSLGLTLICLATLTNLEDLYDYQAGTFNEQILNEKLESIRYRYSPYTWDLLKSMVTISELDRPDFVSLSNTLLPYQDQIRASAGLPGYERTEGVKRAGFPEEEPAPFAYTLEMADDLESRIKAALERSEATFRAVAAREGRTYNPEPRGGELAKSYVSNSVTGGATAGGYGTTDYGLNRSGVNQTVTVNQGLAGSGIHQAPHHETAKRSALPETGLAQSGLAQSGTYGYSYTAGVPATGGQTPGGSYNYSSSYVPTTTYGAATGGDKLANSTYGTTPQAYGTTGTATYGATGTTPTSTSGVYGTAGTTVAGAAYGTSATGTYGATGTTPKASNSGVYGTAGTTTGAAYGTSATGTYTATGTTPKAYEASTTGVYGATTSAAYGTSASGAYVPTGTTPKAQETTPTHVSGTYTPTAIYGTAASGTYGTTDAARTSGVHTPVAQPVETVVHAVETTVVETTIVEPSGQETTIVETTVVETTGPEVIETTTVEVVETVPVEEPVHVEPVHVAAEEPAKVEEAAPVVEEDKTFFEKVKEVVEDAVEKVQDVVEDVVDAVTGEDDKKPEEHIPAAETKVEEEHKEATTTETTQVESEPAQSEEPAAVQSEEPAQQEEAQDEKPGKKGRKGKKGGR